MRTTTLPLRNPIRYKTLLEQVPVLHRFPDHYTHVVPELVQRSSLIVPGIIARTPIVGDGPDLDARNVLDGQLAGGCISSTEYELGAIPPVQYLLYRWPKHSSNC